MMSRMRGTIALAALVCASGCDGVFGLTKVSERADASGDTDASSCVKVGHDEDGDGLDDACDPCPFATDNSSDDDGDGIGLACDPQPTRPNQVLLFTGFGPDSATDFELTYAQVTGDALHASVPTPGNATLVWGAPGVDNVIVMAGFTVSGTLTTASYRQLGVVFDAAITDDVYGTYCVLGKHQSTSPPVDYTQTYSRRTGVADVPLMTQPSPIALDAASGTMRAEYSRGATPQIACAWEQSGSQASVNGSATPLPSPGRVVLFMDDVAVDIRYLFIVSK
jgi:hypothetical protein